MSPKKRLAVGGTVGGSEARLRQQPGGLLLLRDPGVEVGLGNHPYGDRHVGVVLPADLRALAEVDAFLGNLDPALVEAAGNDGLLDAEAPDRPAMHGVG